MDRFSTCCRSGFDQQMALLTLLFCFPAETCGSDEAGSSGKPSWCLPHLRVQVLIQFCSDLTRSSVSERRSEEAAPWTSGEDHSAQRETGRWRVEHELSTKTRRVYQNLLTKKIFNTNVTTQQIRWIKSTEQAESIKKPKQLREIYKEINKNKY